MRSLRLFLGLGRGEDAAGSSSEYAGGKLILTLLLFSSIAFSPQDPTLDKKDDSLA
jgi:hypothetical protein